MNLEEFDIAESNIDNYVLNILARVISLEEKRIGRMSGLRVFCRMDVSVYRTTSGDHRYFVNEITRTHGTALFPKWDSNNRLGYLFKSMSNVLHYISSQKLYL